jgi:hypothetical protein
MPKPAKAKPKQKPNPKRKPEPEEPGITAKKEYWVVLAAVLAVASAVFGFTQSLGAAEIAMLIAAVVVPIGVIGFVRISPSTLSISKRATFLFMGMSLIGFGIWAAIVLVGGRYGLITQVTAALGSNFFIVTTLSICLSLGALAGELIGRNREVQIRLFNSAGQVKD